MWYQGLNKLSRLELKPISYILGWSCQVALLGKRNTKRIPDFLFWSKKFIFHKSVFGHTEKRSKIHRQRGKEGKECKEFPNNKVKMFNYYLKISVIVWGILDHKFLGHYGYLYQYYICNKLGFLWFNFQHQRTIHKLLKNMQWWCTNRSASKAKFFKLVFKEMPLEAIKKKSYFQ